MIEFIVVAYSDGAECVSKHLAIDEKDAYIKWSIEQCDFLGFERELDYVQKDIPTAIDGLTNVWRTSFVFSPENTLCTVTIIGRY